MKFGEARLKTMPRSLEGAMLATGEDHFSLHDCLNKMVEAGVVGTLHEDSKPVIYYLLEKCVRQ